MRILVLSAVGHGRTLLSAFDAALYRCGVANYNLIPLSSVIPPGAEVAAADRHCPGNDDHGHKLYVVRADARSDCAGEVVGAGIGWYQWGDGRGVFVEHEVQGRSESAVAHDLARRIDHSLRDLCAVRGVEFVEQRGHSAVSIAAVDSLPTCALVVAVYRAEGWR